MTDIPLACFTPQFSPELSFTLRASTTAIQLCRSLPKRLHTRKSDGTPVCLADLLIQSRIHRMLLETFPDDGLVAEEELDCDTMLFLGEDFIEKSILVEREWILDPIDGTKGYLTAGNLYATGLCLPDICAGIAIAEEGLVILAEKDVMYIERVCEGVRIPSRKGWLLSGGNVEIPEWGMARRLCCGSLIKYAAVARGAAEVFVQVLQGGEKVWDHAAGLFVVVASGGCVSDEFGRWVGVRNGQLVTQGRVIIASSKGTKHDFVCEIVARALSCQKK